MSVFLHLLAFALTLWISIACGGGGGGGASGAPVGSSGEASLFLEDAESASSSLDDAESASLSLESAESASSTASSPDSGSLQSELGPEDGIEVSSSAAMRAKARWLVVDSEGQLVVITSGEAWPKDLKAPLQITEELHGLPFAENIVSEAWWTEVQEQGVLSNFELSLTTTLLSGFMNGSGVDVSTLRAQLAKASPQETESTAGVVDGRSKQLPTQHVFEKPSNEVERYLQRRILLAFYQSVVESSESFNFKDHETLALKELYRAITRESNGSSLVAAWASPALPQAFRDSLQAEALSWWQRTSSSLAQQEVLPVLRQPDAYLASFLELFDGRALGISGSIFGATGAGVEISYLGPQRGRLKTDARGRFYLPEAADGEYTFLPVKQGYLFDPEQIQLRKEKQRQSAAADFASFVKGSLQVPSPDQVLWGIEYTSSDGKTVVSGRFKPLSGASVEYFVREADSTVEITLIDGTTVSGTFNIPSADQVKFGVSYGVSGSESIGTYVGGSGSPAVPATNDVLQGIIYTATDGVSQLVGARIEAAPPEPSKVLKGITYTTGGGSGAQVVGTLAMPPEALVLSSLSYTSENGQVVTGSANAPLESQVLAGIQYSSNSGNISLGTLVLPSAGQVLEGAYYGASGLSQGSIPRTSLSEHGNTLSLGFYEGNTLAAVDADLISSNIKSGANIFGVLGSSTVVETSTSNATAANIAFGSSAYVGGALVNGSLPLLNLSGATNIMERGLYERTVLTDVSANLLPQNIISGVNIFGVQGGAILVATGGNASAQTILQGYDAVVDGNILQGTMQNLTVDANTTTLSTGYYATQSLSSIEGDLSANNIRSGANLFGIQGLSTINDTSSANAVAGNLQVGATAWVSGTLISGSINTITLSDATPLITEGFIQSGNLVSVDSDLLASNIKAGVNLFGITGGSSIVDTTSANALGANLQAGVTAYVGGSLVTGNMNSVSLSAASPLIPEGFHAAGNLTSIDADLLSSNLKFGANLFGITGSNLVQDTSSANAVAANLLVGNSAWVSSNFISGSMAAVSLSPNTMLVSDGYVQASNLQLIDVDLVASNLKAGVNIFGITGSSVVSDTSSGNAVGANMLVGNSAWVSGNFISGSINTITLSDATPLITEGFIQSGNLVSVDADLLTSNIKWGANLFGITGSNTVQDTSSANALAANLQTGASAWVSGNLVYGSLSTVSLSANSVLIPAGFHETGNLQLIDSDFVSANLSYGTNLFGVMGNAVTVNTSAGNITGDQLVEGYYAYSDGNLISGNISVLALDDVDSLMSAGVYPSANLVDIEPHLVSANITSGTNIFGIMGAFVPTIGSDFIISGNLQANVLVLQEQSTDPNEVSGHGVLFTRSDTHDLYLKDDTGLAYNLSSNIFFADANGNVLLPAGNLGLGTLAPEQTLHVAGNVVVSGNVVAGNIITLGTVSVPSTNIFLGDGSAANPSFSFDGDTGTGMFRKSTGELAFSVSGTEVLSMASNVIHFKGLDLVVDHYFDPSVSRNTQWGYGAMGGNNVRHTTANEGYDNTALGYNSMNQLTTGYENTAVGSSSLRYLTTGYQNSSVGAYSMHNSTSANQNTYMGYQSGYFNQHGEHNVGIGYWAGKGTVDNTNHRNTMVGAYAGQGLNGGVDNVFMGGWSGFNTTSGSRNVAIGKDALLTNTTGSNLVAVGFQALALQSSGANNTAVGHRSLASMTSGDNNTAMGYESLVSLVSGGNNTGFGSEVLFSSTAGVDNTAMGERALYRSTGNSNSAFGRRALYELTSGDNNTAFGKDAGTGSSGASFYNNTLMGYQAGYKLSDGGDDNTFIGYQAGYEVTSGNQNVFIGRDTARNLSSTSQSVVIGFQTGEDMTSGNRVVLVGYEAGKANAAEGTVAIGYQSLLKNTSGNANTAVGRDTLKNVVTGHNNTAFGTKTLEKNTSDNNSAFGALAMQDNSSGVDNVAMGYMSMQKNTTGQQNLALGYQSMQLPKTGDRNVALGFQAGYGTSSSDPKDNVFVGYYAGRSVTSGANNVFIGYQTGDSLTTGVNNILIGHNIDLPSSDNSHYMSIGDLIYGDLENRRVGIGRIPTTDTLEVAGTAAKAANGGWNSLSDRRVKEDIRELTGARDRLMELRPVEFRYRDAYRQVFSGIEDRPYLGFIAQEFREVFPNAVQERNELAEDGERLLQMDPYEAMITAIKAAQEQQEELDAVKAELSKLKVRHRELLDQFQEQEARFRALLLKLPSSSGEQP